MRVPTALGVGLAAAYVADLLPTTTAMSRLRVATPLSGAGRSDHVALTFDDGPDPETTDDLLACLERLRLRATFFLLAGRARRSPHLVRRIIDQGHEIALHGGSHRPHVLRTPVGVVGDIRVAFACLTRLAGVRPRFWRPPHGIATAAGLTAARSLGMRPVLWTADAADWRPDLNASVVEATLRRRVNGGGVVLLHEGVQARWPFAHRSSSDVVPGLAAWCTARGWQLGPLAEHGVRGVRGTTTRVGTS